jgi:hypothetical protein
MTNDFKFTFGEEYKADFTRYVNEIITVTKAQVQAKRDFVKKALEKIEFIYGKITEEDKALAKASADHNLANTLANRSLRMLIIENLTDCYVAATGERPEGAELERLTNAILHEELTDMHPDKITRNEYPFMSEWQFDGRHGNEYSDTLGEAHGSDGRKHSKPTRRVRTGREHFAVNKHTKSRNVERKRKYREFTKVQPVKHWNMNTGEVYE